MEEEGWTNHYNFLNFMNRVLNPLLPVRGLNPDTRELNALSTEYEVENFLDLKREPDEKPSRFFTDKFKGKNINGIPPNLGETYDNSLYKTRVLAIVFDQDEYDTELKNCAQVARDSASRESLRFGILTDQKLIKKLK